MSRTFNAPLRPAPVTTTQRDALGSPNNGDIVMNTTTHRLEQYQDGAWMALTEATPGIYGDGSDGDLTFDGTTTVLGMAPSFGAYTLTRDIYANNLTLSSSVTAIAANGFRIFVAGIFNCTVSTTISCNGGNSNGVAAGAAAAANTLLGGGAGGGGASGGTGSPGSAASNAALGGAGGNGGAATGGGSGGGQLGGSVTAPTAAQGGVPHHAWTAIFGAVIGGSGLVGYEGGGGGGAGNASSGTGTSGGGGGGGGVLVVAARVVTVANAVTLTLAASGGNGGPATAGTSTNCGGGGGGGGGAVILVYGQKNVSGTLTLTAAKGTGHAGVGTGRSGVDGTAGATYQIAA